MLQCYDDEDLEVGVDEVARGCLAGPVFAAAVIWPKEELEDQPLIKDSKKLSKQRREYLRDYIEENAIDFSVSYMDNNVIDNVNILNATYKAMHSALDNLNVIPDSIIVDGHKFKPYSKDGDFISHKCIIGGDNKYIPIACASILAKVYHDEYIENLMEEDPDLKKYGWDTNMCYGTSTHIEAIKEHGLSKHHRKTFGICKNYV